jgi:hypothetical protein
MDWAILAKRLCGDTARTFGSIKNHGSRFTAKRGQSAALCVQSWTSSRSAFKSSTGSAQQRSFMMLRKLEILYIGDFDPSGMQMSEVDLPGRVEKYGGVADITRIALTSADCTDALPSFSVETKRGDPRYAWFKRNYGDRCWELDAMNPNDLRRRLRNEIIRRIDMDAWARCQAVEKAERESLNKYIRAWPKSIFEPDQKCPDEERER